MLDLAALAELHAKYREAAALPVADFALERTGLNHRGRRI